MHTSYLHAAYARYTFGFVVNLGKTNAILKKYIYFGFAASVKQRKDLFICIFYFAQLITTKTKMCLYSERYLKWVNELS